ncbi:MAG: hypothetical protein JSS51_09855, partial [Planctomycetes bacterium]|nr:hypothetical protein [Planctomycetota bacterium]
MPFVNLRFELFLVTIRKQPSDFHVEELLAPETLASIKDRAEGIHTHALYQLEKASL